MRRISISRCITFTRFLQVQDPKAVPPSSAPSSSAARWSVEVQTENRSKETSLLKDYGSAPTSPTQKKAKSMEERSTTVRRPTTVLWVSSNSVSFDDPSEEVPSTDPARTSMSTIQPRSSTLCLTVLPREIVNQNVDSQEEHQGPGHLNAAHRSRQTLEISLKTTSEKRGLEENMEQTEKQSITAPSPAPPILTSQTFITKRTKGLTHSTSMNRMPRMEEESGREKETSDEQMECEGRGGAMETVENGG